MQERVRRNTADKINQKIDRETRERIAHYALAGKEAISEKILELDKEWDTERVLEVNMPVVALTGIALSVFVNLWWLVFPVLVLLFFLQHAVQGWCPPLSIFRRLGYRTKNEIHREKYALKLLRGDFDAVVTQKATPNADEVFRAVSD